jgi:hypothetical protein
LNAPPPAYLDECVDQRLAPVLRVRGYAILTATEARTLGATDQDQLGFASAHDLVIISYNRRHFRRLHALYLERGAHHPGIVLVPATSLLPRLIVRSAMMLDWIVIRGERRSRLFEWGDLQYQIMQGFRLAGHSESDVRLALGQSTR